MLGAADFGNDLVPGCLAESTIVIRPHGTVMRNLFYHKGECPLPSAMALVYHHDTSVAPQTGTLAPVEFARTGRMEARSAPVSFRRHPFRTRP